MRLCGLIAVVLLLGCESPVTNHATVDTSFHLVGANVERGAYSPATLPILSRVQATVPRVNGWCDLNKILPNDTLVHLVTERNRETCEFIIVTGNWRKEVWSPQKSGFRVWPIWVLPRPPKFAHGDLPYRPDLHLTGPNVKRVGVWKGAPKPLYRDLVIGVRLPDGKCDYRRNQPHAPGMTPFVVEYDDSKCEAIVTINDWTDLYDTAFRRAR
jgi:hypothetical protein